VNDSNTIRLAADELPAPGTMKRIEAFGARVLIANVDGEYHAVSDTCTHEDASLSLGALGPGTVSCPLHGSRFCLRTGMPLEEPAESPLTIYRVTLAPEDGALTVHRPVALPED
jgi:nitrite reductase/ring-hydroxylating ferredoxin subunit